MSVDARLDYTHAVAALEADSSTPPRMLLERVGDLGARLRLLTPWEADSSLLGGYSSWKDLTNRLNALSASLLIKVGQVADPALAESSTSAAARGFLEGAQEGFTNLKTGAKESLARVTSPGLWLGVGAALLALVALKVLK